MPTQWQQLLALADRLEPRLARAYLAAIEHLRKRLSVDAIARTIADQRYWAQGIDLPLFEQALEPASAILRDAIGDAGDLTAARFTDDLRNAMRFDLTNPLAVAAARETAAGMVTNISAETRLALQNVIVRAIQDGITYSDSAKIIRSMVGLTARDAQAALNFRRSLIELGVRRDKVQAQVRRYADKKLRERALTIARSEIMQATNAGQRVAWWQANDRGMLPDGTQREWWATPGSDRTCPICLAMHGKRVPLRSSFVGGNPPRHPRCRCVELLVLPGRGRRGRAA